MKAFIPTDVARILRALDLAEFAGVLNEVVTDITLLEPSEARARIVAEAGTRAMFVLLNLAQGEVEEFELPNTPRPDTTTVVMFGPTQGLIQRTVYRVAEELVPDAVEAFVDFLRRLFRRR